MKIYAYLTGLMLFTTSAFAQMTPEVPTKKNYIEVVGNGELEIIPDEIYISITIRERQEGKKKITVESQEVDLKNAVKELGIPMENLTLSDANADYVKVGWTKKDVVSKKSYTLKVADATTVGKVFEKLDALKILDAYISHVSHSKIEEFKKQVRIMAIKAAKDKAEYLLAAIDEKMGNPIVIYEQNSVPNLPRKLMNLRGVSIASEADYVDGIKQLPEIQFKKIKLQSSIYVKFEIL
ncbi:SIMPL domain-containing protein [bacterium SCSIO 12643]|nr:SIMPL domain-containing protein [bacterium SCSIO 12643]